MIRNDDSEKLFLLEKKNLKYLNLFRLFVSVFFWIVLNSRYLDHLFLLPEYLSKAQTVSALYLGFSTLIMVMTFVSDPKKTNSLSKLVLYLDLFVLIYLAFAIDGFQHGIGMLPILPIGSAAILYRRALFILLAPLTASILIWYLPSALETYQAVSLSDSSKMLHSLGYFGIALLGIRQSVSYTSTLQMYRSQRQTISGLENMNQIIIENLTNGVIIFQQDKVILHANQSAKKLLQMEDIIFFPPEIQEFLDSKKDGMVYRTPNGNDLYLRKARVTEEQSFAVLFIEDSTFLKKAAQQLNLASLGKMSSSIAHEIRNPLAAISTAAELLNESPALDRQDKQLSEIIFNQTRRANHIIEDVLEMSKRKTARPEELYIIDYLTYAKEQMVQQKLVEDHQIHIDASKQTTIQFDPDHLQQVIWNLATNAIKHGEYQELFIEVYSNTLDFKNKGAPFRENRVNNLFEPFYTTHNRGTGLGLHICRQLCHDNHAELNYQYENGYHVFRLDFNLG